MQGFVHQPYLTAPDFLRLPARSRRMAGFALGVRVPGLNPKSEPSTLRDWAQPILGLAEALGCRAWKVCGRLAEFLP